MEKTGIVLRGMGRGKMKEQGSRNGGGRGLRRIRGFGAHACRRHACGGTASFNCDPRRFLISVPQARLRGHCPRRVPARGRNVRPARRIRCVFVHARPKSRTNPFSHSHAPGLESASGIYKTEKEKRAGSSLLHMSTECSMCTGRQNTRHRKPYPFALCICIGIYIYINICIKFFILCRKETIGFISLYA